jgi:hypothetical protein
MMESSVITALVNVLDKLDPGTVAALIALTILSPFGVLLIVATMMIRSEHRNAEILRAYRDDTKKVLECYGKDMEQLSSYYKDNVELVHSWRRIAEGFQQTVVLNTATMQRVTDMIDTVLRNK